MSKSYVRWRTNVSSSWNEPGSSSFSIRSRAVYLPFACCFSTAAAEAEWIASSRSSWSWPSSSSEPFRCLLTHSGGGCYRRCVDAAPIRGRRAVVCAAERVEGVGERVGERVRRGLGSSTAIGAARPAPSRRASAGGRRDCQRRANQERRTGAGRSFHNQLRLSGSGSGSGASTATGSAVNVTEVPHPAGASSTVPLARSPSQATVVSGSSRVIVISPTSPRWRARKQRRAFSPPQAWGRITIDGTPESRASRRGSPHVARTPARGRSPCHGKRLRSATIVA